LNPRVSTHVKASAQDGVGFPRARYGANEVDREQQGSPTLGVKEAATPTVVQRYDCEKHAGSPAKHKHALPGLYIMAHPTKDSHKNV
jgi:hypothetical protein